MARVAGSVPEKLGRSLDVIAAEPTESLISSFAVWELALTAQTSQQTSKLLILKPRIRYRHSPSCISSIRPSRMPGIPSWPGIIIPRGRGAMFAIGAPCCMSVPIIGGSSFMHAASSWFVHFPLVPAWLCFKCCRKWSARKNFLD